MPDQILPPPVVDVSGARELARDLVVIPNQRVPLVPNIGVIGGQEAVPDVDVLFTGDLAETGQFAIFPWFPPYDVDVSGVRWIEVMRRLAAGEPATVVPGQGDLGGPEVLSGVLAYLELLRDETRRRRDSAMAEATIVEEVTAVMLALHPD